MKLVAVLGMIMLFSCSKIAVEEPTVCVSPGDPAWLVQKSAEYTSCRCLTEFRKALFNDKPVFEIRGIDPLCNGINQVYNLDGTLLLSSADQAAYQLYLDRATQSSVIWTCSKGKVDL